MAWRLQSGTCGIRNPSTADLRVLLQRMRGQYILLVYRRCRLLAPHAGDASNLRVSLPQGITLCLRRIRFGMVDIGKLSWESKNIWEMQDPKDERILCFILFRKSSSAPGIEGRTRSNGNVTYSHRSPLL